MQDTEFETLWKMLIQHQGETFHTVKGLEFQYRVTGGELFVNRKAKSITKATVDKALDKVRTTPAAVTGPKSLGVFGAPYIWALFIALGVVEPQRKETK